MSDARQHVVRPMCTARGNRPDRTPSHHVDRDTGMIGWIGGSAVGSPMMCRSRRYPSMRCICISALDHGGHDRARTDGYGMTDHGTGCPLSGLSSGSAIVPGQRRCSIVSQNAARSTLTSHVIRRHCHGLCCRWPVSADQDVGETTLGSEITGSTLS